MDIIIAAVVVMGCIAVLTMATITIKIIFGVNKTASSCQSECDDGEDFLMEPEDADIQNKSSSSMWVSLNAAIYFKCPVFLQIKDDGKWVMSIKGASATGQTPEEAFDNLKLVASPPPSNSELN